ncbi:Phage major capsid protein E [compost metagenome]
MALLSTQIRGGEGTTIQRGMLNIDEPLTYVMTLGGIGQSLEIWTYKDVVEAPNGDMIDILDPRDVLLTAPGNEGVIAYGAIWDADAMLEGATSVDVYPKMWSERDPGEVYVMHQSSPLPFVLYPNRTLKARVL